MIDEREVTELLRAATDDIAVPVAPTRDLAVAGSRRRRRRRVAASLAVAAVVAGVSVTVPVAVRAARTSDGSAAPATSPDATTAGRAAGCVSPVPSRLLPSWARTGFTDPRPHEAYLLSDSGDMAAILFAQPLTAPPSGDHNNKILWVTRVDQASTLHISATLGDGSATVAREVPGGPGPSIIDLPRPGCWQLTLQWGGHTDTLDLAYVSP